MVRVLDTGVDATFQDVVGPYPINFFQDFDMLEVGNTKPDKGMPTMTPDEWQAHYSLWAGLKYGLSPLF